MPKIFLNGEELLLQPDSAMKPGREGTVYPDPTDPALVIKLPHTPDDEWREKLRVLLDNPLSAPDIAWPTEAVYALDRSTIIGCRLPYAAKKYPIAEVFSPKPSIRWFQTDYASRLEAAINLTAAVNRVHQHGCVVGDLSPTNILVGKETFAPVCLIDMDSVQITRNGKTHRCKYAYPDYIPQELHPFDLADIDRTVYHEAFALACIIFQLFIGPGIHPFAVHYLGTGKSLSRHDLVRLGIWPYATKSHPDYVPRTDAPFDLLHPLLQPLVRSCFEDGHARPLDRPLPADWLLALTEVKQDTDFVNLIAPRLEADARARHSQAVFAATRPPMKAHPPARSAFAWTRGKFRFRFRRKVFYPIAAAILLLFAGFGLHSALTRPITIDYVTKTNQPLPTPALYKSLSDKEQVPMLQPGNRSAPLPTPKLYDRLTRKLH
jgi:DNA-binding helix-hairpin-helix protein with protein kinase domain